MKIQCDVNLHGEICPREAVEVLLIEEPLEGWYVRWRCDKHPAADDLKLLESVFPTPTCIVLPIPESALRAAELVETR